MFVMTVLFVKDALGTVVWPYVFGLITNGAFYIGGNVLHAWQKSKHFQAGLVELGGEGE